MQRAAHAWPSAAALEPGPASDMCWSSGCNALQVRVHSAASEGWQAGVPMAECIGARQRLCLGKFGPSAGAT